MNRLFIRSICTNQHAEGWRDLSDITARGGLKDYISEIMRLLHDLKLLSDYKCQRTHRHSIQSIRASKQNTKHL